MNVDQNPNTVPSTPTAGVNTGSYTSLPVTSGTALYVVKKSLLTSVVPALIYLFFIGFCWFVFRLRSLFYLIGRVSRLGGCSSCAILSETV